MKRCRTYRKFCPTSEVTKITNFKFQYYMNRNDCDKMKNNFYRKLKDKQDTYFLRGGIMSEEDLQHCVEVSNKSLQDIGNVEFVNSESSDEEEWVKYIMSLCKYGEVTFKGDVYKDGVISKDAKVITDE